MKKYIILALGLIFSLNKLDAQILKTYKVTLQWVKPKLAPFPVYIGVKSYNGEYGVYQYGGMSSQGKLKGEPLFVVSNYRDRQEIKRKIEDILMEDCKILGVSYYVKPSRYYKIENSRGHYIPVKTTKYEGKLYGKYKVWKKGALRNNYETWLVSFIGQDKDGYDTYYLYKKVNGKLKFIIDTVDIYKKERNSKYNPFNDGNFIYYYKYKTGIEIGRGEKI